MSDVNYDQSPAMMAARGQTYGKAKQQMDAQRAVPMGRSPVEAQAAQAQRPRPNAAGSLTAPTTRPNEPITAGAPFGPGPGPAQAGILPVAPSEGDVIATLQYLNQMYPNSDLENLIDDMMTGA